MTPEQLTGWSTAGLVFFALVQVLVTWRGERSASLRDERARAASVEQEKRKEAQTLDTAHAIIHAEWFRIWTTSQQWSKYDLIVGARDGTLDPSDILPRDWGTTTERFGELGYVTSYLGSYAFAMAYDAFRSARELILLVRALDAEAPGNPHARKLFLAANEERLRKQETKIRSDAVEAAYLLEDAMAASPVAKVLRTMKLDAELRSKTAKRLKAHFDAHAVDGTLPNG